MTPRPRRGFATMQGPEKFKTSLRRKPGPWSRCALALRPWSALPHGAFRDLVDLAVLAFLVAWPATTGKGWATLAALAGVALLTSWGAFRSRR
jgi:hypothetical protein